MISCGDYDYIEIVCMYRYPVKLSMKTGETIEGVAIDTQRNDAKKECIKINIKHAPVLVVLDEIAKLEVSIENPHFNEVSFT